MRAASAVNAQSEPVGWGTSDGHTLPACFGLGPEVVPLDVVRAILLYLQF